MKAKVVQVINNLVKNKVSFTAYDITKILRLAGESVRHRHVRPLVHEAFTNDDMGIYHRTLCTLPGIGSVNVFHQPYSDPDNYLSEWVEDENSNISVFFPDVDTSSSSIISAMTDDDDDDDDDVSQPNYDEQKVKIRSICLDPNVAPHRTFHTTKDGRLNIPSCVCKAVGFGSEVRVGQTTVLTPNGEMVDGLAIQPPSSANSNNKCLHVDTDQRIRINPRTLNATFDDGNEYKITYDNNSVYIYQD